MAKQGSRKGQDKQSSDRDKDHNADAEQPSSDKTGEGLPLDMLLQAGQETETPSSQEEDLASLLSSFQEGEDEKSDSETEEDRELSRMISLMTSGAPGLVHPGGAGQERSAEADEALEALPEGTEVILDREEGHETTGGGDEPDTAEEETELASVSGDETLEDQTALDGEDGSEQGAPDEDETVGAEAVEDYDVTDTVDALLSTIGLDDEQEGRSFAPPVPEGGVQDDGTPVEELVDDRILEDFQELHKNLQSPIPVADGVSAAMNLSGSLSEGHAHILCIDDDPDNRSLFKGILDAKDHSFVDAESGEEALEVLREREVDLVLLNLDIVSQDGFELIEETASDVTLSQVPILVNSASVDHIEKALRLGASDYLIRPMSVIDVKFQIPIKVKNLLKIRRAERMLTLTGGPHDGDMVAVPPMGEGPEAQARDLPVSGDEGLSDLLSAGGGSTATKEMAGASAESLEDLFKEDEKEDEETQEDLTAVLDEKEEDLTAVLTENAEDLFKEDEKEDEETQEDLTAALDEKKDEETQEDLAAVLDEKEEDLDKLFDDSPAQPVETDQASDDLQKVAGLGAAGATAAIGAAAMSPAQKPDEEPRSVAEILAQPSRKGSSPIWRSPDIARSHRERMLQERRVELPRRSGRRRLFYATFALLLVGVGVWALWAKQRLRETGEVTSVFPAPKFQIPETSTAPAEKPVESSSATTGSESASSPAPSGGGSGYEQARERASLPSRGAKQLASEKAHLRATVDQIAAAGGQWWAPWRVIRESGESIRELVNARRRDDILEVFGVSEEKVEQGLRREAVVSFLSKRGFKIRGKQASDLSAREMFEILSMREIKTRDKVIAILSALKDKATAARAERAARLKATPPSRFALRPEPLKVAPPARHVAAWEQPIGGQQSAQAGQTAERPHPPPS
ncbi:response regulator [bacterium]|nr:response regulator [bacterium]